MKKLCVMLALLLLSAQAHAFTPWQGQWWNPNESGSGYNIDVQNGVLVITIFSYSSSGEAEWYVASGPLANGGKFFSGTLDKYRGGQCISCSYSGSPRIEGNDGALSISFSDEMNATMQFPGRSTAIVPYRFGMDVAPRGLLGEWVFTYDIITTWADRFNFTQTATGTSSSNGMAFDPVHLAGCELEVRGTLVGYVVCADVSSTGARQNGYIWKYGIDQTYAGSWVSPSMSSMYSMKGLLTKWPNGAAKIAPAPSAAENPLREVAKAAEEASSGGLSGKALDLALSAQLDALVEKVHAARSEWLVNNPAR